ncbi:MAG: efflux RND transporter periplasmic adaptor subunit [Deltaproteobacteria bacterium]|nr:MAG: efflux RND transporter periplasmic adaptor subunit [Deltaproteobacteria bacterium]
MRRLLRWILPIAVLAVGAVVTWRIIAARPPVATQPPELQAPLVRVMTAQTQTVKLNITAQGTVVPRTESELVPEVSGTVVWASPSLVAGGFFEADEVLLRIDPTDYEIGRERARAALARSESELRRASRDLTRRRALAEKEFASDAAIDIAENAERVASAAVREARAQLRQAERDLARTEIGAPYAGRVRDERVDVGQFVSRGMPVATVYAVDAAEIRLPISDDQLAFVDLPTVYRGEPRDQPGPAAVLRAEFAGREHVWTGQIVRTEGEIDPRSRVVHVIAQVEDPYGRSEDGERPPLAVGLFVEAEIEGREVEDVVVLPRAALRNGSHVLVVDPDDRLRIRAVDVLRVNREAAILRSGVRAGERICLSPLDAVVDGMKVRTVDEGPERTRVPS